MSTSGWMTDRQAMENQPHPTTILDLPLHILHDIFQHFQDPRIEAKGRVQFGTYVPQVNRDTLRNARLVCRLFNNVASPFLFSIVGVELNQESLDELVQFSNYSQFAQHVRGIEVWLDYRPGEIATDMATFSRHRKSVLEYIHGDCYTCRQESIDFDDGPWTPGPLSSDCELFQGICARWDDICGVSDNHTIPNDNPLMQGYEEVLRESFDLYRQRHEEQRELIVSRSFVQTVSSCVSRMPNFHALALLDEKIREYHIYGEMEFMRDQRSLVSILQRPLSWEKIEDLQSEDYLSNLELELPAIYGAMLLPARILTELPIALHDSGTTLRDLYVGSFPLRGKFSAICAPSRDDPQASILWTDLQTACQKLRSVDFRDCHGGHPVRYDHLTDTESMYVNGFVGAILCSQELEVMKLSVRAFGLNKNGVGRRIGEYQYDVTSSLAAVRSPRIRSLTFSSVKVGCSELTALCAGLGHSMETLRVWNVHLRDGSWAGILDILRAKVKGSCCSRRPMVELSSLSGGEFEAYSPPPPRDELDLYMDWGDSGYEKWRDQAETINNLAEWYVSGVEDMQNPFSTASHIIAQEKYERLLESR